VLDGPAVHGPSPAPDPAAGERSSDALAHDCRGVRKRILANGVLVVGASIIASMLFTEISFRLVNDNDYGGSMLAAMLIPLFVATPVYGWIAALTLRLERSNAALDWLAHTDPLTGIANRRAAMASLREWTDRSGAGQGCAIAIADVDDFKCINDAFGHDTGDAALGHVATILQRLALSGWVVARIGREEFLLAAPTGPGEDFAERVEAIREVLGATPLITPAGPHIITASFGLAQWQRGESAERLLSRADRALYQAQRKGRNRVEQAA
jgi:diguanylate cyclase (GGDEF)-like protein